MASASTPANMGLILVHTVNLKPITKEQISGKLVTSGVSDVAITTVHSEITRMKKMIDNWRASEASETLSGVYN